MLDDSSSEEEYTPSTFSDRSSVTTVEHLTVHQPSKRYRSATLSPGLKNHGSQYLLASRLAPLRDIFTQSQVETF